MEVIKAINTRRSVRRFKGQDVPEDLLLKVLEAGRMAPSGGNLQPWEFIVVKNRQTISKLTGTTYVGADRESGKTQSWIETAPLVIVVCINNSRTVAKYGEMGSAVAVQDVAAAVENILLAAVDLGLACCWVGGFRQAEAVRVLKIPESVRPLAFLPLGYADIEPAFRGRYPLEEMLFYESYGNREK